MKLYSIVTLLSVGVLGGCSGPSSGSSTTGAPAPAEKPLVVFSQANSQDPWRKVFDAETKSAAEKHASEFDFEEQEAGGDPAKQNDVIDTFMVRKPKVLLVSPTEESVKTSIEKAYDGGASVILLDRSIPGDKYTVLIGGDNHEIGKEAGEYVAKRLSGKGTVLVIQGIAQATPTKDRESGFEDAVKAFPGIKIIAGDDCGYQRQKARSFMESFLQKGQAIDCVYAHNDEMAIGARLAWDAANPHGKAPLFVGIDGCQQETINMIKEGKLDATFQYPTPGAKGIEVAAQILQGKPPKDKKITLPTQIVTKETADKYLSDNPNLAK